MYYFPISNPYFSYFGDCFIGDNDGTGYEALEEAFSDMTEKAIEKAERVFSDAELNMDDTTFWTMQDDFDAIRWIDFEAFNDLYYSMNEEIAKADLYEMLDDIEAFCDKWARYC